MPIVAAANGLPVEMQVVIDAVSYAVAAIVLGPLTGNEVRAGAQQVGGIAGRFNPRRKALPAGPDGSTVKAQKAGVAGAAPRGPRKSEPAAAHRSWLRSTITNRSEVIISSAVRRTP
jgi:hypothetical protein